MAEIIYILLKINNSVINLSQINPYHGNQLTGKSMSSVQKQFWHPQQHGPRTTYMGWRLASNIRMWGFHFEVLRKNDNDYESPLF